MHIMITILSLLLKLLPLEDTHGGVMIYYKTSLALRVRPDLENQQNTLVCEISVDKKTYFFRNISKMRTI